MDPHTLQTDTPALPSKEVTSQNLTHLEDNTNLLNQQTFQNNVLPQNSETCKRLVKHDRIEEPDRLEDCFQTLDLDSVKTDSSNTHPVFTKVNLRERQTSSVDRAKSLYREVDLKRNEPRLTRWASESHSLAKQNSKTSTRPLSLSKLEEFDCPNKENEASRTKKKDTGSFEVVHSKAPTSSKLTRGYSRRSVDHSSLQDVNDFVRSVVATGRVDPTEWHRLEHSFLSASCSNIPETDEVSHPNTGVYSESNISSLNENNAPFEDLNETKPVVSVSMTSKRYKDIKIESDKNRKEISQDCDISNVLYEVFETIMAKSSDNSIKERVCSSIENIDEESKQDGSLYLKSQLDIGENVVNNVLSDSSEVFDDVINDNDLTYDPKYCSFSPNLSSNVPTSSNNCSVDILREVIDLIKTALPETDISKISLKQKNSQHQESPSTPELFAALKWLLHKIPDEEKVKTGNNELAFADADNDNSSEVFAQDSIDYHAIDSSIDCSKKELDHSNDDKENQSDEKFWSHPPYVNERAEVNYLKQKPLDSQEQIIGGQDNTKQKYDDHKYRVVDNGDKVLMNKNSDAECHTDAELDHIVKDAFGLNENTIHTNKNSRFHTSINSIQKCDLSAEVTNLSSVDDNASFGIRHSDHDCPSKTQPHEFIDSSATACSECLNNISERPRNVLVSEIQPVDDKSIHGNTCLQSDVVDDVTQVVLEPDDNKNDYRYTNYTDSKSKSVLDHNDTHKDYENRLEDHDRPHNEQAANFNKDWMNKCETFWSQEPPKYGYGSTGIKHVKQEPLNFHEHISQIQGRPNTEQGYENHNSGNVDEGNGILMSDKSIMYDNRMVSQGGYNYSSNQNYQRSPASHDYQPLEKFVISSSEQYLKPGSTDKYLRKEFTLETSSSTGSPTNESTESSEHQHYYTTKKNSTSISHYIPVSNHRHQSHSTVSHTSRGSVSDSSSMTSETSVKTDGTQTDSCSAKVDYSYEIEKLRAERQRVCDMLTRCDYGHSRERVQAVEAQLNYGIGQMDTLLGYVELEPVRSSRVRGDRVLRDKPATRETTDRFRTATTTTITRRSSNNIVQNQNDYFRRLGLRTHQNSGSEASANAKLVLGFDRGRNRVLRNDNIAERDRYDVTERYSQVLRTTNPVMTSLRTSNPVMTSLHTFNPVVTSLHSSYPVMTSSSFRQNNVSIISPND